MGMNFAVDFLLLLGTNQLSGFSSQWKRAVPAAFLGAVYSGACLLSGFRFLGSTLWRIVALFLMGGIAFGWNRSTLRRIGVFVLLAMAMGGLAVSLNREDYISVVGSAAGIWVLCRFAFPGGVGQSEYVPLEIRYGKKMVSLIALRDSGNLLRDPVTGQQVLVISAEAAKDLTGLTLQQLQNPLLTITQQPHLGLRLIPYHTVGQGSGMLLAMRFEQVKIGSRYQSAIVAFDTGGLGKGESYQALTGGVI